MIKYKLLGLFLLVFLLIGCKEQTLLNGLDQKQANEVVAILQSYNIDAVKQSSVKEGFSILVDKSDFLNAVNLVNHYDLPSKTRVEVAQMFPEDSLVASPLAEKARLYSAIEQRLEQSLKTLNGVISASLHISYDFASENQLKRRQEIHLTAIVRYENGYDDQLLIADIKRFLKNSFNDVEYENISVVMTAANKYEYLPINIPKQSGIIELIMIIAAFSFVLVLGGYYIFKSSQLKFLNRKSATSQNDNVDKVKEPIDNDKA